MTEYRINLNVSGEGNLVTGKGDINVNYQLDAATAGDRRILQNLQDTVEKQWIDRILTPLIESHSWLQLDQEAAGNAITNPLAQSIDIEQVQGPTFHPPQRRTAIADIYFSMSRRLLILGEPGSGKTTALATLARALIQDARNDRELGHPVPVVLNLGTWNARSATLLDWIIAALARDYLEHDGERLLRDRRLVLLLDGLDEVPDELQASCVRAINRFNETVGSSGVVVSSRLQDYSNLIERSDGIKLRLHGAVTLRPLTDGQIDTYLESFGATQQYLRLALKDNGALRMLARTPLMLNVMAVAYETGQKDLAAAARKMEQDPNHRWLFDAFVRRMLDRKPRLNALLDRTAMLGWLGWLARQSERHRQPLFLLERLQPSWLEKPVHRWSYFGVTRVLAGMLFGQVMAIAEMLDKPAGSEVTLALDQSTLAMGALIGAGAGTVMGMADCVAVRQPAADSGGATAGRSRLLSLASVYFLVWGAAALLLVSHPDQAPQWGEGIGWALLGATFFATRARGDLSDDIRLPERLGWSWTGTWQGLLKGGASGAGIAALIMFAYRPQLPANPTYTVLAVLAVGALLGSLMGMLFGAFRGQSLRHRTMPNQGIRKTWVGCGLVFVLAMLSVGLLTGATTAVLSGNQVSGVRLGLILGLCAGLAALLWYGGLALIRHYVLRGILIASARTPFRYVRFLNRACDLVFLRQIGGGYCFMHDLLRTHLRRWAEMHANEKLRRKRGLVQ